MTEETAPERALDRRFLMRGGAVLAGAAGLAAVGAVVAPTAQAADGGGVILGELNESTATTTITAVDAEGGSAPTLTLVNATGPALKLEPSNAGGLSIGEISSTEYGPQVGVLYGGEEVTAFLATEYDLLAPIAFTPERLIDTRSAKDRATIIGSSGSPFDTKGQLKAGAYIDISVGEIHYPVSAVFLNLTAVNPATSGFLVAYPSGFDVPSTSSVNFQPKVTVANAAFVAVGVLDDYYAIRVYAAKASHVIVDLTGMVFGGYPAVPGSDEMAAKTGRRGDQARRIAKMRRSVTKTARR